MSLFDEIKSIDLDDLFSTMGVQMKGTGTDNVTLRDCPCCGNSNWKVRFSRSKKVGHCFYASCEANFSVPKFVAETLGCSMRDAFVYLESYMGTTYKRAKVTPGIIIDDWQMPESIALPDSTAECNDWLEKRKILPETQELFGLRYCRNGFYKYRNDTGTHKVSFNERVLMPVIDMDNRVVTFQGRATWDVDESVGEKRYLFPTGLPGSSHFLYGEHIAKGKEKLVLVEGPFDAMSTYQAISNHPDFQNYGACGTFGLSLGHSDLSGDDQLGVLRRLRIHGLKEAIILWDSEKNAYNNAVDACLIIRSAGIKARIATLGVGKDPNEVPSRDIRDAISSAKEVTKLSSVAMKLNNPYS